jgi:PAS domain S-box-containing protein
MVGYSPEELIGKRGYLFLVPKEEQIKITEGTTRRVAGGADSYECTQITKSGKRILTIINACPYRNTQGEVIGNIASIYDITAKRETELENERLQKQLNRSQRMEAVGQLAAGFAHDLNNSLTAIVAHLNLIKFKDQISDESRSSLDAALSGCRSASELIKNVLSFSADSPIATKNDELRSVIDQAVELT